MATSKSKTVKATSTKSEIFTAYQEAKKKIQELESMNPDPYAVKKVEEKERRDKSAEDFVGSGYVSEVFVQKMKDLKESIADKEKELKDLYNIEVKASDLSAMIGAYNLKKTELDEAAKADADQRKADRDATIAQYAEEVKTAKEEAEKTKKEADAEVAEYKKQLKIQRDREAEEFTYNLNRSRSKENDEWSDQKKQREKELSNKEANLNERIDEVTKREEKMNDLETQVASIDEKVKESYEKGKADGKAEAEKSHAFEKRYMEKDAKYNQDILQSKIDTANAIIKDQESKIAALEEKLDNAYKRNQELATTVAQNGGSKTYITGTDQAQTSGKK